MSTTPARRSRRQSTYNRRASYAAFLRHNPWVLPNILRRIAAGAPVAVLAQEFRVDADLLAWVARLGRRVWTFGAPTLKQRPPASWRGCAAGRSEEAS
jgi:hypothetical protein